MPNKPLVLVEWVDAEGYDNWVDRDEFERWCKTPLKKCYTIGWLEDSTEEKIVVYSTDGGSTIGNATKIPRTWVLSIKAIQQDPGPVTEV